MNRSQSTPTSLFSTETIDKFDETTTMTAHKIINKDHSGLDIRGDAKKKIISKAIQQKIETQVHGVIESDQINQDLQTVIQNETKKFTN